jgi:hypothetical protein
MSTAVDESTHYSKSSSVLLSLTCSPTSSFLLMDSQPSTSLTQWINIERKRSKFIVSWVYYTICLQALLIIGVQNMRSHEASCESLTVRQPFFFFGETYSKYLYSQVLSKLKTGTSQNWYPCFKFARHDYFNGNAHITSWGWSSCLQDELGRPGDASFAGIGGLGEQVQELCSRKGCSKD